MYYADNSQTYVNNLAYRIIYSPDYEMKKGKINVSYVDNNIHDVTDYYINMDIIDISDVNTYTIIMGSILENNKELYNNLNKVFALNRGKLILKKINDNHLNDILYNFVVMLNKFGIDGYYMPATINTNLEKIDSHIYIL